MDIIHVSVAVGLLLIIACGWDDFNRNVRKSKHRWRFYLAGGIFTIINITIYLLLVRLVFMNMKLELQFGPFDLEGPQIQLIAPIVLALFYFAAGAGTFQLGTKKVQINRILIGLLQNMFSYHQLVSDEIRYSNATAEETFKTLRQLSKTLRAQSKFNGGDSLQDNWDDYLEDELLLQEQIDYLKSIDFELGALYKDTINPQFDSAKLEELLQKIRQRIGSLRQEQIRKLQKFLVSFAFKNYRDDAKLEAFLLEINVLPPTREERIQMPNVITRSLVMGFMFGLFFGPIFRYFRGGDASDYCFLGATALMGFTGIVSYGIQTANWTRAIIWSGVGGYIVHLYWNIVEPCLKGELGTLKFNKDFWTDPMMGLSYGIITACLLYFCKTKITKKFKAKYALYLISPLAGALIFPLVYMLMPTRDITQTGIIITGLVGALAMLAMSLSVNVGVRKISDKSMRSPSLTPVPG